MFSFIAQQFDIFIAWALVEREAFMQGGIAVCLGCLMIIVVIWVVPPFVAFYRAEGHELGPWWLLPVFAVCWVAAGIGLWWESRDRITPVATQTQGPSPLPQYPTMAAFFEQTDENGQEKTPGV
jgi:hypothetical protein